MVAATRKPAATVSLPVALAACRGVDQAAEPGGGVVDEFDEPGVTSQRVPFADEDGVRVQVGPGGDSVPVRTRRSPPRPRR